LMAWKKSTVGNLREQFTWPVSVAVLTAGVLVALGMHRVAPVTSFALCAFVSTSIFQEFVRGARVRKDATGSDVLTALVGLVTRERRRYGGYIVHLGIVLMFIGFTGEAFKTEQQFALAQGQTATLRHFSVRNDGVRVTDDGQKQMVTGQVAVFEDGKSIGTLSPARWFYRKHEEQPTTEVAIRRGITEDLYLVMPAYELKDQSISVQVVINPLVNWIWMGFTILVLGTGICLLPERTFAFALAKIPAGAAATPLVLMLGVALLSPQIIRSAFRPGPGGETPAGSHMADTVDRENNG
jgi:cytochrome c-type biogenesis protein CcmF